MLSNIVDNHNAGSIILFKPIVLPVYNSFWLCSTLGLCKSYFQIKVLHVFTVIYRKSFSVNKLMDHSLLN